MTSAPKVQFSIILSVSLLTFLSLPLAVSVPLSVPVSSHVHVNVSVYINASVPVNVSAYVNVSVPVSVNVPVSVHVCVRCLLSVVRCLLFVVLCPMSRVPGPLSSVPCSLSPVPCPLCLVPCPLSLLGLFAYQGQFSLGYFNGLLWPRITFNVWTPAYTPGDGQTSRLYSNNPVLHLYISCYVTVNKPVLSYLSLRLLPQTSGIVAYLTKHRAMSINARTSGTFTNLI
jgi:hypothetical protein